MSAETITPGAATPEATGHPQHALLAPHQIIVRPLVTEKGMHRSTRYNAYAFEVNRMATKHDIRKAVEELFNVKVVRVHIQNRKGKPRRSRVRMGVTQAWKKAIVKLDPEHRIDFF
ncbi:MAG TPA: 50S ribosomal protein L23 [Pirellulales bacterium]